MTVKCIFCNDTKIEPGIPGPCVWCETAAESIKFGTGIMLVGADGAKNVPLGDVLIETKAFRLLPYGTKFRYQGTQDVWVRIGHNLIAKWPCDLFGRDGQPCQSLCSFCHLESDDSGDTLDTLVEVVDSDLALIADLEAALAREAALREEQDQARATGKSYMEMSEELQQRLTVAEQREAEAREELLELSRKLEVFYSRSHGIKNLSEIEKANDKAKSLKLRVGKCEALLNMSRELLTTISRHGATTRPVDWCESFKSEVADRIEKIGAALKPAAEGEGS